MVLVRYRRLYPDLPAQPDLANSARLRHPAISQEHSCSRRRPWPCRWLPSQTAVEQHCRHERALVAGRFVFPVLHRRGKALSHDRMDVRRSVRCFIPGARTRILSCPAYPMLIAAGAVWIEQWMHCRLACTRSVGPCNHVAIASDQWRNRHSHGVANTIARFRLVEVL